MAALRELLRELIDYAGLFPPAALPMTDAVGRYAAYRRGADAWALGRFIVPMARLDEFARVAERHVGRGDPWRVAALLRPAVEDEVARLTAFNDAFAGFATIDVVEAKAADAAEVRRIAAATRGSRAGMPVAYVEIPPAGDPGPLVAEIREQDLRAKIRTGGVTPDAFPGAAQVATFLAACSAQNVAFKATAGLHHPLCGSYPLTYETGSQRGPMFGFLNLFVAALMVRSGLDRASVSRLLVERDPASLTFDDHAMTWDGHRLPLDAISDGRARFAIAFGSCSFDEPVGDLHSLGLL